MEYVLFCMCWVCFFWFVDGDVREGEGEELHVTGRTIRVSINLLKLCHQCRSNQIA
jgi:hypothetical protein